MFPLATRRSSCGSVDWNINKNGVNEFIYRRSSCGSVDWNSFAVSPFRLWQVAPLVGAWIDIWTTGFQAHVRIPSLLLWERGLKYDNLKIIKEVEEKVAPLVGAWIEIDACGYDWHHNCRRSSCGSVDWNSSLGMQLPTAMSRSSCGSVDWNSQLKPLMAEFSGRSSCGSVDWNTVTDNDSGVNEWSLLLWERGLKLMILDNRMGSHTSLLLWERGLKSCILSKERKKRGRSSCGSVDWNYIPRTEYGGIIGSILLWERGLK